MSYNGQRFGIASGLDGRVLYFNKDVMAAAGLPADWQPKSWADIITAAQAIKAKEPGVTPLQINAGTAMGEATTAQGFLPLLVGTGVNIYDATTQKWQGNTPQIQNVLKFYQQIYGGSVSRRSADPAGRQGPGPVLPGVLAEEDRDPSGGRLSVA